MIKLDNMIELIKKWRYSPYKFSVEFCGAIAYESKVPDHVKKITSQQKDALEKMGELFRLKKMRELGKELSEEDYKTSLKYGVSLMSGKGTGKTTVEALLFLWFLVCWTKPLILCLSGSKKQLSTNLWREIVVWINKAVEKNEFVNDLIEVQGEKIFLKGVANEGFGWCGYALSFSRSADEDALGKTLAGKHEQHMLDIFDEAEAIPNPVFVTIDTGLSDPCNGILLSFNPRRNSGYAIDTHYKNSKYWIPIRWNAEDSPLVSKQSIERIAEKYGKDSNAYRVNVLGLPPKDSVDTLIQIDKINEAVGKELQEDNNAPIMCGIDIACGGHDDTIFLTRKGNTIIDIRKYTGDESKDLMYITGQIMQYIYEMKPYQTVMDCGGVGAGVYARLRELKAKVTGVLASWKAYKQDVYVSLKDELWYRVKEKFDLGIISIPDDEELIYDLSNVKVDHDFVDSKGRLKIRSKKLQRKDGIDSTDKGDALCLSYYYNKSISNENSYVSNNIRGNKTNFRSWMGV